MGKINNPTGRVGTATGWKYSNHPIPEIPRKKVPEWATFIIGRSPQFKMHTSVGQAKNAMAGGGICYRWMAVAGEMSWIAVAVVDCGTIRAEHRFFEQGFTPDEPAVTFIIEEEP